MCCTDLSCYLLHCALEGSYESTCEFFVSEIIDRVREKLELKPAE